MLVLGVFMAVFLTAALYYVIGLGEAIAQREQMQDAADAAAFSAAAVHARGMNVLALINMVMAALLAVLIALKLVETLTTIALVAISVMSFLEPGLAGFIPALSSLRVEVHDAGEVWQTQMNVALRALHAGAVGVRDAVPLASELPVIAEVTADYAPRVHAAVVVLSRETLPTKDGTFQELCERAQSYLGEFTRFALGQVAPPAVAGIVSGAVDGLTKAGTGWFCGADEAPPSTTVTRHAHYPALPSRRACLDYSPSKRDYDAAEHSRRCDLAERDEQDSEPDDKTGNCVRRCELDGPYQQRDALARSVCAVRKKHEKLHAFVWQERHFTRSYVFQHGVWNVTSSTAQEEQSARYERGSGDRRPCGEPNAAIAPGWNVEARDAESGAVLPVCSNEGPPAFGGREDDKASLDHVQVLRFFGCEEEIEQQYDMKKYRKDRITADDDKHDDADLKRVPQVLEHGLELGAESFQLRAVVGGTPPSALAQRVLEVATWQPMADANAADSSTIARAAQGFGRVSMAQAEYFFDVRDPEHEHPEDFMWSMRWKARLKRFRLPERGQDSSSSAELGSAFQAACSAAAAATSQPDDGDNPGESPCSSDLSIADLFAH
jgi:hypothetical protein